MTALILDPLPDSSGVAKSPSPQVPDARYNFLAHSILSSLGENGGISLVVADSSVQSGFLRETLEQIHGDLRVFEVPCRQSIAGGGIIPSLPQFISSAARSHPSLPSPGALTTGADTRHAPMLFICDGAEGLEDEQLDTMYSLSRGRHGPLGVVLLAKPEFLLRMQNSRFDHLRAALSACFWSQHSSYGAAVRPPDRQDQIDGFMPLNPAQLPAPLIERLTAQSEEAALETDGSSLARNGGARIGRTRFPQSWRHWRLALTLAFSLGYLLVGVGTAYVLSWLSRHPQIAIGNGDGPGPVQLTISLPPAAASGAGSALVRPPVASPPVAAPHLVKADPPAPATAPPPPPPPAKSAPSLPAVEEPPAHKQDVAPAPAEPVENTQPAISTARAAPPKPDAPAPEATLSEADRALFAQRGNELLAAGDIASARLFFERAANAGDARSALGMAKTFDPAELAKAGVRGVKGDQAKADYWYQRARVLAGDKNFGTQVKDKRRD